MLISVAIPTRNRPDDVGKLLDTIVSQTRRPDQIIVVDQSPGDETHVLTARSLPPELWGRCTYVHDSSIRGVSAARNAAIALARGDVVVFLDDDVTLTADCLQQLEVAFDQHPDYTGIGGVELQMESSRLSYLLYYDLFFVGPFRDRKYWISRNHRRLTSIQRVTGLKTCLAGFRREFLARHRFDERWRSALLEDLDLCWQVRRGPEKFGIWPYASAWHAFSQQRDAGGTRYRATSAAWSFFMRKNIRRDWMVLPWFAWLSVGLLVNGVHRSIASRSMAPLAGLINGWTSLFRPARAMPYIDISAEPFPTTNLSHQAGQPECRACQAARARPASARTAST